MARLRTWFTLPRDLYARLCCIFLLMNLGVIVGEVLQISLQPSKTLLWPWPVLALFALSGLAVVDIVLLLPLLLAVLLILLVIAFVMCVLGIVGIGLLLSVYKHAGDGRIVELILRGLAGVALVTTGAGFAALLALGLNAAVRWLGGYARLHYRLLKPDRTGA